MSEKVKLVAVAGSLQQPSRTSALVEAIVGAIADIVPIESHRLELGLIAAQLGGTLDRRRAPAAVEAGLRAIEGADALVVASPVYRGAYSGLFKHLFDLVDQHALVDVPVLLAATGGSERHALVIDHQLRPLFSFFQARTLPVGVYGATAEFTGYEVTSVALRARVALAAERAAPWLRKRSRAAAPPVLMEA